MIISQTAEYALRAIVCLAAGDGHAQTTQEIAETTKIPADYLSKILQNLRRSGLVSARRGLHGGFVLSNSSAEVSVLAVINAIDPVERIVTCPLKLDSHGSHLCPLHCKLDQAMETMEKAFAASSIRDLLKTPSKSRPLCGTPGKKRAPQLRK